MPTGLNVARVANVQISLAPLPAAKRNFGAMLFLGSSNIIDTVERFREFDGLDSVAATFGLYAPEYLAADLFFSQSPQPAMCYIGRWAQNPTPGVLHGAVLTPLQQQIAAYQQVTSGAFFVLVDGKPYALTGINLSAATNLNGVASILQAALQAAGASGARIIWGAINQRFDVISGTTGNTSTVSYVQAPTATTSIAFSGQPAPGATLTLNGSVLTFGSGVGLIPIGAATSLTLASAAQAINTSTDPQIAKFTASASGTTLYLWSDLPGASGNALTVAASANSNGTVAASPMAGGSGTDISVLLGLSATANGTGANASPPVPGIVAESYAQAVATLADMTGLWYGIEPATAVPPTQADILAASAYIEGATLSRIHAVPTQNTAVMDPTRTDDTPAVLKSLNYNRSLSQYSSGNPYAIASLLGRLATVNWEGQNTALTLKFKQEPGLAAEALFASQADALEAKRCNVFVGYNNDTAILEQGVMAGGYYIDERVGLDWFQNALQVDLYNLIMQMPNKVAQTDEGQNLLVTQCYATAQRAKSNGLVAPGIWTGPSFGTLNTGDKMQTGIYFYSDSFDIQDPADRALRKAMPIMGAVKLAGAIHSVDAIIYAAR